MSSRNGPAIWRATPRMSSPWPTGWRCSSRRYGISVRRGADCWCYGATSSARFPFSPLGCSSWRCRWGRHAGNTRSAGVPSPTVRANLLRNVIARGGRARLPLRRLHRSASLRPDATGPDGGRRHRPDRSGRRHRLPGHHRELSGQHLPQHAAAVRDGRPGRGCRRDRVRAAVERAHDDLMTLDGNLVQIPTPAFTRATSATSRPTPTGARTLSSASATTIRSTRPRRSHGKCWRTTRPF
jgi:hypothetical protein